MKWGAPSIMEFCRAAGVDRDELATYAACALSSSGGHDRFDVAAGIPGTGRWVGLWAHDVDRWPEWAADDLYDPYRAARAAWELTRRYGDLRWCATYRNGQYLRRVEPAVGQMSYPPFTETEHVPNALVTHQTHHEPALAHRRAELARKIGR